MIDKTRLYEEIDRHICHDDKPSLYLQAQSGPTFTQAYPFTMLSCLKDVEQSPRHHPEGNVWNHTLLVLDEAADKKTESSNLQVFMWAALLHDIGKAATTKVRKGKITAYDHDKKGAEMSWDFLISFTSEQFAREVSSLVRWHMQILYLSKSQHHVDLESMRTEVNVHDVALLGLCDRLGRREVDRVEAELTVRNFLRENGL